MPPQRHNLLLGLGPRQDLCLLSQAGEVSPPFPFDGEVPAAFLYLSTCQKPYQTSLNWRRAGNFSHPSYKENESRGPRSPASVSYSCGYFQHPLLETSAHVALDPPIRTSAEWPPPRWLGPKETGMGIKVLFRENTPWNMGNGQGGICSK